MGLLKNIDPLLTADLLYVLRAMGHGDMLAVVDCNFPAVEVATKVCTKGCVCLCALCRLRLICDCVMQTTTGKLVVLAGSNAPDTLDAITSVLPIDAFVDCTWATCLLVIEVRASSRACCSCCNCASIEFCFCPSPF